MCAARVYYIVFVVGYFVFYMQYHKEKLVCLVMSLSADSVWSRHISPAG